MRRRRLRGAIATLAAGLVAGAVAASEAAGRTARSTSQQPLTLAGGNLETPLRFLLFLPRGYENTGERWPMILYLHGRSRRGNDLDRLRAFSLPAVVDRRDLPFVVVSPQCPSDRSWLDLPGLDQLIDAVVRSYRVDSSRIYLTGHSMGGSGAWFVAQRYKDRFAAMAPVAAGQVPARWAANLGALPVWILHGEKDDQTPLRFAREAARALSEAGHPPKLTIFSGEGHDILHVYEEDALYQWFLGHRRAGAAAAPEPEIIDPRP